MDLTWQSGVHAPNAVFLTYQISYLDNYGHEEFTTAQNTTKKLTGLMAGGVYVLKIRMVTSKGDSPWSDRVTTITDRAAIMKPTDTLRKDLGISDLRKLSSQPKNTISIIEKDIEMQVIFYVILP